jgi:hypothetical protein
MEWTVEDHLQGQPDSSIALYRRFVQLVEACGPFSYAVSKTSITMKGTRRGFAGARPDANGLRGYFDLQRAVEDPRIANVSPYTKRLFVHQFRIHSPEEMDEQFAGWIREAYEVGAGAHLGGPAQAAPKSTFLVSTMPVVRPGAAWLDQ